MTTTARAIRIPRVIVRFSSVFRALVVIILVAHPSNQVNIISRGDAKRPAGTAGLGSLWWVTWDLELGCCLGAHLVESDGLFELRVTIRRDGVEVHLIVRPGYWRGFRCLQKTIRFKPFE